MRVRREYGIEQRPKKGRVEPTHPACYPFYLPNACPTCLAHATHCRGRLGSLVYHMKRKPTRPVRGARMAVGCSNAEPVLKLIVSAA
jgi:hypothetical protein